MWLEWRTRRRYGNLRLSGVTAQCKEVLVQLTDITPLNTCFRIHSAKYNLLRTAIQVSNDDRFLFTWRANELVTTSVV
jgi:hypothetical protein